MEGSAVGLYLSGTSDHRQRFLSNRRTTLVPYRCPRNSKWWVNNAITTNPTKPNFVVNAM
ncbi:hypothetical protein IGI04_019921 [Brassica rapa subsp. trilocularis]|uniref:Pectin acetylesterase n=1 Tax=Brassica rapa subsp. trilocularis TaxID=1813537 RepID=A0ABQ7MHA4_BRACM|nr:hypothetical protein IGI04_019921 [Brassica rapa subsp. trilocularis]